jgi:hypothetical protein
MQRKERGCGNAKRSHAQPIVAIFRKFRRASRAFARVSFNLLGFAGTDWHVAPFVG